jgi:hypothetical protein
MNVVNTLLEKGIKLKGIKSSDERPTFWQLVFAQSKVNGALYSGEELPGYKWEWPKDTYLQRRLRRKNRDLN